MSTQILITINVAADGSVDVESGDGVYASSGQEIEIGEDVMEDLDYTIECDKAPMGFVNFGKVRRARNRLAGEVNRARK